MEKTWFEVVFRRRAHPVLRVLGNLLEGTVAVVAASFVISQTDSAWRWLIVPLTILTLVSAYRGVAVAVQDFRQRTAGLGEDAA
ncbi:hypothetical protein [Streptomyces sp. G-G2]|uniref:hypothetical protein n=1 Tax=Streptomyces sp. G-G2 TaxID=3046201 RepID=UPI0024B94708|nr:hypothetical protein [Streptomyces sp. G-G2]MDJ0386348.1 hypothetical protein [Streptomyces sp. G-G2]